MKHARRHGLYVDQTRAILNLLDPQPRHSARLGAGRTHADVDIDAGANADAGSDSGLTRVLCCVVLCYATLHVAPGARGRLTAVHYAEAARAGTGAAAQDTKLASSGRPWRRRQRRHGIRCSSRPRRRCLRCPQRSATSTPHVRARQPCGQSAQPDLQEAAHVGNRGGPRRI